MRPIELLRSAARLPPAERAVAGHALLLLVAIPFEVRLRGLRRALRSSQSQPERRHFKPCGAGRASAVGVNRIPALVHSVAAHLPWTSSCLTRSLAAARLIAGSGGRAVVVLGVRTSGGRLAAHSWIEVDGQPFEPAADADWREVARWAVAGPAAP
jgi:hypothetical protein